MKRTATRLLSLVLLAVMLLSAAGCQGGTPAAGTPAPGSDPAGSTGEKPELVFWELPYGPNDTYGPAIQKILDEYNAGNHGATVRLQVLSWSGFKEQFQTSIAAGSPPDITSTLSYTIANWDKAGEVLDLSSIVEKWEAENDPILEDFLPGALEGGLYNGKYVSLPYVSNGTTIYYRTDIMEDELGFTDLDQPVTWDKLYEMCEAVKERYNGEIVPFSFCTLDQNSSNAMINVLFSNGASWVNEDGTAAALDSPEALECMEFFRTMRDNGYFPDGMVTYSQADVEKLYQSGKVAMVWNAPVSHVTSNPELQANTRLMGPVIGPSGDKPRYVKRVDGVMGFAQTKYHEETKEFLEWYVKNCLGVFTEGGASLLPMRQSYYEDPFFSTNWEVSEYSKYKDYYEDIVWPAPFGPAAADQILMQNIIGQPLESLLMGSDDQVGDLAKTQAAMNKLFEEYRQ